MQNKIKLPKSHQLLYKKIYRYLVETLNVSSKARHYAPSFYLEIKKNYEKALSNKSEEIKTKSWATADSSLTSIKNEVSTCVLCELGKTRQHFVNFGFKHRNNSNPLTKQSSLTSTSSLMVIGDIPSFYDQIQKKYLSEGNIYELLKKILQALDLSIEDCYLTASIKCARTTELPYNLSSFHICEAYLKREIAIIKPKLLLAFGKNTYRFLWKQDNFEEERGKMLIYENTSIVFTYHPRDLIQDVTLKKKNMERVKKTQTKNSRAFKHWVRVSAKNDGILFFSFRLVLFFLILSKQMIGAVAQLDRAVVS